jgi:peptidoglycan/LPS O-acetylase OafA/YrhL
MYITTRTLTSNWHVVLMFIGKRLWRIVPLYYIATIIYLAVYSKLTLYIVEHPYWLLPTLFFYPSYGSLTGPAYGFPALEVGWSLSYEIYFYLLMAFCAFAGKWRWYLLLMILFVSVFAVPYLTNGYVMQSLRQWYTYKLPYCSLMTNPVLLFFVSGIALGKFYTLNVKRISVRLLDALVWISIVNFALCYIDIIRLQHGYWHHFFNCSFLIFMLIWRNKVKEYSVPRFFVFLGNSSFSIYLIHPIIIGILPMIYTYFNFTISLEGWGYFVQLLIWVLLFSALSYQFFEKPMGKLATKIFKPRLSAVATNPANP